MSIVDALVGLGAVSGISGGLSDVISHPWTTKVQTLETLNRYIDNVEGFVGGGYGDALSALPYAPAIAAAARQIPEVDAIIQSVGSQWEIFQEGTLGELGGGVAALRGFRMIEEHFGIDSESIREWEDNPLKYSLGHIRAPNGDIIPPIPMSIGNFQAGMSMREHTWGDAHYNPDEYGPVQRETFLIR